MKNHFSKTIRTTLCLFLSVMLLTPSTNLYAAKTANEVHTYDTSSQAGQLTLDDVAKNSADAMLKLYGVSSLQVSIMDNGTKIFSKSYGYKDVIKKIAPTNKTMYGIGSISKMFTTAAVMKLVDQGKVELDKPVTAYIPGFRMADSRYKDITVRMLLNHSSGLQGTTQNNASLLGDNSTINHDTFLNNLKRQYLKYKPGNASVYCNDGFTLAEILVEKQTKMSFTSFVEAYICSPLGLSSTKTPQSKFNRTNLAKTYSSSGIATPFDCYNQIGAGGMYATAEDLCKFGDALTAHNTFLLSSQSKTAMGEKEYARGFWTDAEDSYCFGLGWDTVKAEPFADYGIKAYTKGGDTLYYHSNITVLPEQNITVSVLSSGGASTYCELMCTNLLTQYLTDKKIITPKETVTETYEKAPLPSNVQEYTGTYVSTYAGNTVVSVKDDTLIVNLQGIDFPFEYTTSGKFVAANGSLVVSFKKHNDTMYIEWSQKTTYPNLGANQLSLFLGQKLVNNPISADVKKVWEQRNHKVYLIVSEKYTSAYFVDRNINTVALPINLNSDVEGYASNMKIAGKNLCYSNIELPFLYGRDGAQVEFYKKGKVEYARLLGHVMISQDGIGSLPNKKKMTLKIPSNGYGVYYEIDSKTANKKATFTVPKNASFVLYDENGTIVTNYYINKKRTVKLPKDGLLLIMGSKNAKFTVTLK